MDLYDVMRTTFAARDFLDEPVPDAVIRKILDNARFAPSGGNRQGWKVIVVREPSTRGALAEMIVPPMKRYLAQMAAGENPWNSVVPTRLSDEQIAETDVPGALVDALTRAPVILIVLVDLNVVASFDQHLDRVGVISGASIYPFVWNILLAARNEGYGGTLTTFVAPQEQALKALLDIPEHMAFTAMLPLGKPVKQLTKLNRKPVEEFVISERWGGGPL